MVAILLDTCALIWLAQGDELAPESVALLSKAADEDDGVVLLSPISAWEIGLLVSRQRLHIRMSPHQWFAKAVAAPGVRLADMSPDVLIASSFLPGRPPRDPADRIIAATARDVGATLITRDRALLDYGKQGHVNVVAC